MMELKTTPKERFAFFLPGLYDGGAERIMLNLAKGIADKGYPVDLVLACAVGPFMNQIPACVRLVDLKVSRAILSTPPLVRYLRRERPYAILSVLYANIIALWASRLAGVPVRVILAEHNTLSSVAKGEHDVRLNLFPVLAQLFYPWSDAIIAVSRGVADDLGRTIKMASERIQVVYNPIVTSEMFERSRQPLDHPWFKPYEPPVLLAAGRLTAQKGFDVLLRAFSLVRKDREVRLLILGEGEDRANLEAMVKEMDLGQFVSLPGYVTNPYPYMSQSAAFVLSSRWEGLPTVLVEALALGMRVVSTDCPSGPREILKGGKFGRLVPVDDPVGLADGINACLDEKVHITSRESWEPFALDTVVDQYTKVLLGI